MRTEPELHFDLGLEGHFGVWHDWLGLGGTCITCVVMCGVQCKAYYVSKRGLCE